MASIEQDFERALATAYQRAVAYREQLPPPRPLASLAQLRGSLDIDLPQRGRSGEEVICALADAVEPGLIGITSPDFYGWVMGASHPVAVAADWLTSAWGQNAGIYHTSPAAAVVEEVVSRWLLELLDLPAQASVGIVTGATMANFVGLASARSEVLLRVGWDLEQQGFNTAPAIQVFLGEEAHSTVYSALRYLGFGQRQLIRIATDDQGRMSTQGLADAMAQHSGPMIVVAQAGHINSGAFDDLAGIAGIAREHQAWLHVDGAFGLWANAVPELAHLCDAAKLADSWAVDGHKWLQAPYDTGFAIVKHPAAHRRAMAITASYLNDAPGDGRDPSSLVPELSRRARGFAVWALLQSLGREGVAEMIARHCRCAGELQQLLQDEPGIAVINRVELNQLALVFGSDGETQAVKDAHAEALIADLQQRNSAFVSGASWRGQWIMRVSIISRTTDSQHIEALAQGIISAWRARRMG